MGVKEQDNKEKETLRPIIPGTASELAADRKLPPGWRVDSFIEIRDYEKIYEFIG